MQFSFFLLAHFLHYTSSGENVGHYKMIEIPYMKNFDDSLP